MARLSRALFMEPPLSKADDVFYREFAMVLGGLVVFTIIAIFAARLIGSQALQAKQTSPKEVAARIAPVGQVRTTENTDAAALQAAAAAAPAAEPAAAADVDGAAVYIQACTVCHAAGVAGAPKSDDKAAWQERLAKGVSTLVQHAVGGFNAMPAKGGQTQLSDAQVEAAVRYMLEQAGLDPG